MSVAEYPVEAVAALARRLESCGAKWVLGGSTGLAMRGVMIGRVPRDIDIYADEDDAARIHACLAKDALDVPQFSETDRYRSILSHYSIEGAAVELVGNFRIAYAGSHYRTEVERMLYPMGDESQAMGVNVRIVPLGHELIFNILRERDDRCSVIGEWIRRRPAHHLPPLQALLARNELAQPAIAQIAKYVDMPESELTKRLAVENRSMPGSESP